MKARIYSDSLVRKIAVILLSLAMLFTMMPTLVPAYAAETGLKTQHPALVVTGSALIGSEVYSSDNVSLEKTYTLEELKALKGATVSKQKYSALKSKEPFAKNYYLVDGVKIASLLGKTDDSQLTEDVKVFASDGYAIKFLKDGTYENGKGKTVALTQGRYFYDFNTKARGDKVPAVIGWADIDTGLTDGSAPAALPGGNTKDIGFLRLYVGQLDITGGGVEDMNQPLWNGKDSETTVNMLEYGNQLKDVVLTVGTTEYTRADLLKLDYAEYTYKYTTKKGDMEDTVRGIPFSVLLKGAKNNAKVSFETADNYDGMKSMTVKELNNKKYMLAYAIKEDGEWKGIYDADKENAAIYGFLKLYGDDGSSPSKFVNKVTTSSGGIDYSTSPFKHITNGGKTGLDAPYNIDAITGATLTIEGPGTKSSVPLSVRDLESQDAGCRRGNYTDIRNGKKVTRKYEGIDLYYLLTKMSSGDNGIKLTDEAKKVVIKNRYRKTIASFSLATVKKMSTSGRPILVAYGTSFKNNANSAKPFVFDDGAGGNKNLGNYDGCLKLVYDRSKVSGNKNYKKFANMAYIYVEEAKRPGYKHNKAPYKSADNSQYVMTITGSEIGREVNFTVQQLENMVKYNKKGNVRKNLYAYRDDYSLANSTYWYVNTYEGVKLWSLLRSSGIKKAAASDKDTMVTFQSTDNYGGFDTFSLYQVAHPKSFGFYEKNAADLGDGTYKDVKSDLKKSGYPVLVAYGVNGYPYVKDKKMKGYKSGLQNDGGPLRIISGKMNYNHANGSNQAKYLDKVIVGNNDHHYATHAYHEKEAYTSLADNKLTVNVVCDGKTLKTAEYTVGDIEKMLYSGELSQNQMLEAKVKAFYETKSGKKYYNNLYEGMNLGYFLSSVVGLPGSLGTITFANDAGNTLTQDLETVLELSNGYNKMTKQSGLAPVLAYAKGGAPLVATKSSAGYEGKITLGKGSDFARNYGIYNYGGPLKVVFPRENSKAKNTMGTLSNVSSITIDLTPDHYSHSDAPYDTLLTDTISVGGEGTRLTETKSFTVADIEGKQKLIQTVDYSVKDAAGNVTQERYRGIPLYAFLSDTAVALKNSADEVIVKDAAGKEYTFGIADLIKSDYTNTVTGKKQLPVLLAYGAASAENNNAADGKPLVRTANDAGYVAEYNNDGGPLKLVVGQADANDVNANKMVVDVKSITVTAKAGASWNHNSSAVFEQYLTDSLVLKVVDGSDKELFNKTYTVAELEAMSDLIITDNINSTQTNDWEGLDFWKFIEKETKASAPQATSNPIRINVKAKSDGYTIDVLSKVGKDGLQNGVKDGGRYVPVMLAYGMDGYPLASGDKSSPNGPGFDSVVGNNGGPIRLMVHNSQGACLTGVCEITITVK